MGTIPTSAVGGARRAVHVSKRSAAAAAAPHNSRPRSACRWYAWLFVNQTRSRSATIRVRCREGAALVPALVPPAEKLHQVMHAHYLLVLGVPPAASTHRAPLLHAALHAARFHATDSGHHLSKGRSSRPSRRKERTVKVTLKGRNTGSSRTRGLAFVKKTVTTDAPAGP